MRLEVPAQKKLVHEMTVPIRWGDMDAMGHVNNTVYFRYMEQTRITFFDNLGLRAGGANLPPNISPVVMTANTRYPLAMMSS